MAKTITADQIQQGDTIRVTLPVAKYEDRKNITTYEGVAHEKDTSFGKANVWRTEAKWNLYVHEAGVTIELLDRPKPKIVLPTGKHAVVQYKCNGSEYTGRFDGSRWHMESPVYYSTTNNPIRTPKEFEKRLNGTDEVYMPATDFKVLFEGVAK